ncbi:MAG: hypothetical protein EON58_09325 [Alphaproteobacteria bacterium]|nr:MAG: hypothetical protein EON58_09325 [Alphaproteobacteria bacterium]
MKFSVFVLLISVALSACSDPSSETKSGNLRALVSGTYKTKSEITLDDVTARARSFLHPPDYEVAYTGDLGYLGKRLEIHYRRRPLLVAIKIPQSKFEYAVLVFDLSSLPDAERLQLISLIRSELIPGLEQSQVVSRQIRTNTQSLGPNNSFKPNPHQGGAWLHAFGYIRTQSPPCCGSA